MTEIALPEVLDAAAGLSRAARWDDATRLLDAVRTHDPADLVAREAAAALAGEVHRWSTQLGLPWLTQQTAALR